MFVCLFHLGGGRSEGKVGGDLNEKDNKIMSNPYYYMVPVNGGLHSVA